MRRVMAEITWLTRLLSYLGTPPSLPVPIHSDSQASIDIAWNSIFHERTKHVELDCHFVRQQFLSGLISLSFVPSSCQLADLFTKPLYGSPHHNLLGKLGVASLPSNLRGVLKLELSISRSLIIVEEKRMEGDMVMSMNTKFQTTDIKVHKSKTNKIRSLNNL